MKAVIMAGGFGTRLRPLTEGMPKPCVSVVGEPCIVRLVRKLAKFGIREFYVSLFYLPQQIRDALSGEEFQHLTIRFCEETVPLGTAGSVKNCLSDEDDSFLVVSGDGVFDFDLAPALSFHQSHGGPITILSVRVEEPGEFGVILSDENGRIVRFLEKPDYVHAYSDDVNTGIYLCSPSFLELIPNGVCDFSKNVFPRMLEENIPIYVYRAKGYWCDIGTVASYLDCNRHLLSKGVDTVQSLVDCETVLESPCYIGKNVILNRCHIGPYTVVGDGCHLNGTRLEGCVLDSGVVCEPGSTARNAVLCRNSVLRTNSRVGDCCVIGAESDVGVGTTVPAGVKIYPQNRIPEHTFVSGNVHHKSRSLIPEEGRIFFPFGEDFGGASMYELGRALAILFDGDVVVGRAEQKDASAVMTFCGGVLSGGKNVYDTGVNDLAPFRFVVRNYAFRCGAFFQRNYSNLILRLFDENGMPLSETQGKKLLHVLSTETSCGERGGLYRIFRGGMKAYQTYLRSFGIPSRLMMRVSPSPILSPLLPRVRTEGEERMRVADEWIRIERGDGEPFSEEYLRLAACISLGKTNAPVCFPFDFPGVTEDVARSFDFVAERIEKQSEKVRKLFPLTDPNVLALLILNLLEREKCSFAEFVSRLPVFSVKQREISLNIPRSTAMRLLAAAGGEMREGIRFFDRAGVVRIVPKQNTNGFRIYSEAANAETAEELCEFYSLKLKGLKPD